MEKAIFKFNNGNGALLCSGCRKIIKTRSSFSGIELAAEKGTFKLLARYCDECKEEEYED